MNEALALIDKLSADDPGVLARTMAAAAVQEDRETRAEQAAADSRRAADEARIEALQFADRQLGGPLHEMSVARSVFAAASDECADLAARLVRATEKQTRARSNLEFWASRMQQVTEMSSRSAPMQLDPFEAARQRAQIALQDAQREGRHTLDAARSKQAGRSSFRSRSLAHRSSVSTPDGCSRARYEQFGFCACANCFDFEAEASRAASIGTRLQLSYRSSSGARPGEISRSTEDAFVSVR